MDFKLCHNGKFTSVKQYRAMAESLRVVTGEQEEMWNVRWKNSKNKLCDYYDPCQAVFSRAGWTEW
jgi:predicted RecB family nuclease